MMRACRVSAAACAALGVVGAVVSSGVAVPIEFGETIGLSGTTLLDSPQFAGTVFRSWDVGFSGDNGAFSGTVRLTVVNTSDSPPFGNGLEDSALLAQVIAFNGEGYRVTRLSPFSFLQTTDVDYLLDHGGDVRAVTATAPGNVPQFPFAFFTASFDFGAGIANGQTGVAVALDTGGTTGVLAPSFIAPGEVGVRRWDGAEFSVLFQSVALGIPAPGVAVTMGAALVLGASRRRR